MKRQITAVITATLILANLAGCSNQKSTNSTAQPTNANNTSQTNNSEINSEISENNSSDSTIPNGEPTFLIGLDGKAILTSEITRLENTNKTAETLTKEDLWAEVYCDGFAYCKEPLNIGYDSYNNPELFDGYDFLGETSENQNEWKRVYVGDEICGLKVRSAVAHFTVNDWDNYTFPERYFDPRNVEIELDGTVEAEGLLQVNNCSVQYPETNELVWFYPTSIDLPITPANYLIDKEKGYKTSFDRHGVYNTDGFTLTGEFDNINLGYLGDINCDTDGIRTGDIAYARVTLGNIKCVNGSIEASLENVKLLSDILAHIDDDNNVGYGMGI